MQERYDRDSSLEAASMFLVEARFQAKELAGKPSRKKTREIAGIWKKLLLKSLNFQFQTPTDLIRQHDRSPNTSTPYYCAEIISEKAGGLIGLSQSQEELIITFDIQTGMELISYSVRMAEDEIAGKTTEKLQAIDDSVREQPFRVDDEEERIICNIKTVDFVRACADLLRQDPTGFMLVDQTLAALKGKKSKLSKISWLSEIKNILIPDFVVAGAEIGVELYKKLYAICPPSSIDQFKRT